MKSSLRRGGDCRGRASARSRHPCRTRASHDPRPSLRPPALHRSARTLGSATSSASPRWTHQRRVFSGDRGTERESSSGDGNATHDSARHAPQLLSRDVLEGASSDLVRLGNTIARNAPLHNVRSGPTRIAAPVSRQAFAVQAWSPKPSDGLEPSTPSLPWRIRIARRRPRNSACLQHFPATDVLSLSAEPLPR